MRSLLAPLIAALFLLPSLVAAQGFDIERLRLDPSARGSLVVGDGEVAPTGAYRFSATFQQEHGSLTVAPNGSIAGNGFPVQEANLEVVSDRTTVDLMAAYTVWRRLEVLARLPVVAYQTGDRQARVGDSAGLGTPALGLRYGLLEQRGGVPFSVALGGEVLAPLGSKKALAGQDDVAFTPRLELGRRFGGLVVAAQGGALLRTREIQVPSEKPLGHELHAGLAFASSGAFRVEASARAAWDLRNGRRSLEQLVGFRWRRGSYELYGLGGPGMGHLAGTPTWRGLVGIAFATDPMPEEYVAASSIPPPAPVVVAAAPPPPPPVVCPEPSVVEKVVTQACPAAPPPVVAAAPAPPAPKKARLVGPKIEISEAIYFRYADAAVAPESTGLLRDIAELIRAHPEIRTVTIEGHTDDAGNAAMNRRLSLKRARAVRAWLVEQGIDAKRLVAKGFGPDRPVASNDTKAGRERNRRVDFFATWKTQKPEKAPKAAVAAPVVAAAKKAR